MGNQTIFLPRSIVQHIPGGDKLLNKHAKIRLHLYRAQFFLVQPQVLRLHLFSDLQRPSNHRQKQDQLMRSPSRLILLRSTAIKIVYCSDINLYAHDNGIFEAAGRSQNPKVTVYSTNKRVAPWLLDVIIQIL